MLGRVDDPVEILKTWRDAVKIIYSVELKNVKYKSWEKVNDLPTDKLVTRLVQMCDDDPFFRDSVLAILELPQQFPTGFFMQEVDKQVEEKIQGVRY